MRRYSAGVLLGTAAAALAMVGAGSGMAANTDQGPCSVVLASDAGDVTATGTGFIGSNGHNWCHAWLSDGTTVDSEVITGTTCHVVVTGSGRVNSRCK